MHRDGNKLIVEEADINTVLAYAIRDYQFTNQNELPEVVIVQMPAVVSGKDRNDKAYARTVEVIQMPIGDGELAKLPNPLDKLPVDTSKVNGVVVKERYASEIYDGYHCPECKRLHRKGSKIYKKHLKYVG